MNDRTLLRTVLVLTVLSLASNVLVLKSLGTRDQEQAPPANSWTKFENIQQLQYIEMTLRNKVGWGFTEKERDDFLFQLDNLMDWAESSQELTSAERADLLERIWLAGYRTDDIEWEKMRKPP